MNKGRQGLGWVLAGLSFLTIMMMPMLEGLTIAGQRCMALFIGVFFLYLFESIPASVTSIAIVPLLVILGIVDVKEALSGFASTSTYLIIGSFILADAVVSSNLGDRITYGILLIMGTTARRISMGIVVVNILTAFMIPSATARTAMLLPICLKIIKAFRGEEHRRTKFGANLLLTLTCTNASISSGILTAAIGNPMAIEYIESATQKSVSFMEWFRQGFPPAFIMTLIIWALIQCFFPSEIKALPGGKKYVKNCLKAIGPISKEEKKVIAILGATIFFWITGEYWNIDSTTVCLMGAITLCLPGVGFLNWEKCKKRISLNVVFICSGGISLGAAMSTTGASSWIAERLFDSLKLEQYSAAVMLIALIVIVQFMHVFFVGTATMANVFYPIVSGIALVAGIDPVKAILPTAFMISGYPILMFFNTTPSILCYDTGEVLAKDFPRLGLVASVIACVVYGVCIFFFW